MAEQNQGNSYARRGGGRGVNKTQMMIVILIAGILGTLAYKSYSGGVGGFLSGPAEYQLQYMPVDFKINLDAETAL